MDAVRGLMFASGLLPDRKSVEADIAIAAESLGGQHDDCGHPADPGHVAQDGRGPGTDVRERVATSARPGAWGRAGRERLAGSAPATKAVGRAHRVSALATERHLLLYTLFQDHLFPQRP